ncbi:MAG: flagellar FliJ family protein [bacterium]|nr:flagellar FliJ family protein [bacterium]
MKRFEFRLDKVMSYKKNIEEMKKQELAQAMRLLLEAQIKASRLKKYKLCQLEEMAELQEEDVYTRLLYDKYIVALNFHIKNAEKLIEERILSSEQKRIELVEASKARRIFEKLKEKKIEEFDYERNKWEQAIEDECAKYVHNNQNLRR